jgi:putative (di)nucleoside polyphosphate hydrolase
MTPPQDWRSGKPYRPNVGICLINSEKKIWLGRTLAAGPEMISYGRDWQMPQGGIEESEDIYAAASRELMEETSITSTEQLAMTDDWWAYDFPAFYDPTGHKLDQFRGQIQRWVALRFTGNETEIDVNSPDASVPAEFSAWQWTTTSQALKTCVEFKREQYKRVFSEFSQYIA